MIANVYHFLSTLKPEKIPIDAQTRVCDVVYDLGRQHKYDYLKYKTTVVYITPDESNALKPQMLEDLNVKISALPNFQKSFFRIMTSNSRIESTRPYIDPGPRRQPAAEEINSSSI